MTTRHSSQTERVTHLEYTTKHNEMNINTLQVQFTNDHNLTDGRLTWPYRATCMKFSIWHFVYEISTNSITI